MAATDTDMEFYDELLENGLDKRTLLNAVEMAIFNITVTGQSYNINGRSLTRASLGELRTLRRQLMDEIAAEDADPNGLIGAKVGYFFGTGR